MICLGRVFVIYSAFVFSELPGSVVSDINLEIFSVTVVSNIFVPFSISSSGISYMYIIPFVVASQSLDILFCFCFPVFFFLFAFQF